MSIDAETLRKVVEGAIMAANKPLTIAQLQQLFDEDEIPGKKEFEAALEDIQSDMADRGFELVEVSSGWRFQVKQELSPWVGRLWEEKPQKYSRAMLETIALIAYRQPITRGEIEEIRGVAVSSHIIKTLSERSWVKVVGHKDVPGRPSMYATTREFLDYFGMHSLEELPTLAEIRDLDTLNQELQFNDSGIAQSTNAEAADESLGDSPDDQSQDQQGLLDDGAIEQSEHSESVSETEPGDTAEQESRDEGVKLVSAADIFAAPSSDVADSSSSTDDTNSKDNINNINSTESSGDVDLSVEARDEQLENEVSASESAFDEAEE